MNNKEYILPSCAAMWNAYTQEILAWNGGTFSQERATACTTESEASTQEQLSRSVARTLTSGSRKQGNMYIFLGCDIAFFNEFHNQYQNLPINSEQVQDSVLILESQPERARSFLQAFSALPSYAHILVDTSPWALFMLTRAMGIEPDKSTIVFCQAPKQRCSVLEKWRKLFLASQLEHMPSASPNPQPSLSVGAIMHPQEPCLKDFFMHIPSWVHELVIVWDCPEEEGTIPSDVFYDSLVCPVPVKHFYRSLQQPQGVDFAAQRNVMLSHCNGDWLLYVDADERLTPQAWDAVAQLMRPECSGGVLFPRLTFEGDAGHGRMAYGLWPDVQLRLFPRTEAVSFENAVHERVVGLEGSPVLSAAHALLHYSHIYKNAEQLRERLAVFSQAGTVKHMLSEAYPRLPRAFFDAVAQSFIESMGKGAVLRLPV